MSRVDELPADQRAALSLLLRQRKSYADVASALKISEQAVHDRAHAALAVLAPGKARELDADSRAQIGDYLLGQQPDVAKRLRTRALLTSSQPAHAWASALAAELAPLGDEPLPELPALAGAQADAPAELARPEPDRGSQVQTEAPEDANGEPSVAGAGEALRPRPSPASSRRGGAILLALIAAGAAVAVIVIVSGGSGSSHPKSAATVSTSASSASSASSSGPKAEGTIQLSAANGGAAKGAVEILSEGGKRAFYILAEHLPETKGFFYAVWLYNSPRDALAVSKAKPVTSSHRLAGAAGLPSNASRYREILLTRETEARPSQPGSVVLRGKLSLSG